MIPTYFQPVSMRKSTNFGALFGRYWPILVLAAIAFAMLAFPDLAFAQDAKSKVEASAKKGYELVFSIAYYFCAAVIVGTGLMTMTGRMEWKTFGSVVIGVVIVFSGTAFVDYFR